MIYNVGDKVKLINVCYVTSGMDIARDMLDYLGKTVTIDEILPYSNDANATYLIREDNNAWLWHDYLIEGYGE